MTRCWPIVELLVFLNFFATTLLEIITQKHIYNNAASDHANTDKLQCYKTSENNDCGNCTALELISTDAEHWLLYINLASLLAAIPSTILLGIWSETEGRKIVLVATLIGIAIHSALFTVIVKYQAPIYFFVIASLITSTVGYNTSLMASCMAFIADITSNRQRTMQIVFLDCAAGIGIGLAYFISGFFMETDSFQNFLWLIIAISIFNILSVVFSLERSILSFEPTPICGCSYFVCMLRFFTHDPGNGRRWRLLTFSTALFIGGIVIYGTNDVILSYAQTSLCFTLVFMGFLSGALALRYISSLVFVKLFQAILKVANNLIIEAGLVSFIGGLILAACGSTTRLFFIVPAFQFLGAMPLSVMKASLSRLVEPREQGTLFAIVSCLETLAAFLGVFIFRCIYDNTSNTFSGLSFVVGAILLMVPASLVGIIHKNEDPTSRYIFFPDESETDFGHQCTISTQSKSKSKGGSIHVVTSADLANGCHPVDSGSINTATNGHLISF